MAAQRPAGPGNTKDLVLGALQGATLRWILRIGVAAYLVGHGVCGIIAGSLGVPQAAVGGLPEPLAGRLAPMVGPLGISIAVPEWVGSFGVGQGAVERLALMHGAAWFGIGLGLAILVWPWAGLLLVACAWQVASEWPRPLDSTSLGQYIERGGGYGALLALLWLEWSVRSPGARRRIRALQHRDRLRTMIGIPSTAEHGGQAAARGDLGRRAGLGGPDADDGCVAQVDGVEYIVDGGAHGGYPAGGGLAPSSRALAALSLRSHTPPRRAARSQARRRERPADRERCVLVDERS